MTDIAQQSPRSGPATGAEGADELRSQLAAIVESSDDAIIGKTLDGIITSWNKGAENLYGYAREEAVGRLVSMIIPPDRPNELPQIMERLKRGEHIRHFETVRVKKSGERVDVSITISPIRDSQSRITGASTIARDITDRKRVEDERAHLLALEQEARAQAEAERERAAALAAERAAILGQIADGILLADRQGQITFINEAARRILGDPEPGMPIELNAGTCQTFTLDRTPYTTGELPLFHAALRGETVIGADIRVRRSDGSEVIVQANATPVLAEDGTQLGAVASFRDVTVERELERQKDDFLSAAAHDLKTPLTTIKGVAQMLARRLSRLEAADTAPLVGGLEKINATATRMATLINELLDMTRIQMGRPLDLLRVPTDLVLLAKEAIAEQEHTTSRHRLALRTTLQQLVGSWDATRIERVLTNLLSNAIKYSPGGGTVELTLERDGEWAVVSVRDEGLGIPDRDLPHIFERFHRAGNVSHFIPGTGIGLAGACQIVEQHGGEISVESQEGQGSTFTVRLPLTPRSATLQEREGRSDGR